MIVILYAGISPDLQSMEQIRRIRRPTAIPDTGISACSFAVVTKMMQFGLPLNQKGNPVHPSLTTHLGNFGLTRKFTP